MRAWLSRYRPGYLIKLAYMMQASDYQVLDYLKWFERTRDFSKIAVRQKLIQTSSTRFLVFTLRFITLFLIALLLGYFVVVAQLFSADVRNAIPAQDLRALFIAGIVTAALYLLVMPWAVAYLITVPVAIGRGLFFAPYQWWMVSRARRIVKQHPATKIAIAGSFGKTTMKEVLKTVLSQGKNVAATPANFNTPIGISRFVKSLKGNEEILIFEFGEYKPNDVKGFCKLAQPDIGVITGVNEAHLSQFKNIDTTAKNIFTLSKFVKPKRLYVNEENQIARKLKPARSLHYSRQGVGQWKVSQLVADLRGTRFTAKNGRLQVAARSKLIGKHQVGALVVAIDIATKSGLSETHIQKGLIKTEPFAHRLAPRTAHGITVIDDTYNGNPDGVKVSLEFLRSLKANRKIYVTPGLVEMGSSNQEVHRAIGLQLAKVADVVMLIKNNATPFIAEGLKQAKFTGELLWFEDPSTCYNSLELYTKAGDVVLLQNDWPEHYL